MKQEAILTLPRKNIGLSCATHGNPQGGEPIQIGLLETLMQPMEGGKLKENPIPGPEEHNLIGSGPECLEGGPITGEGFP